MQSKSAVVAFVDHFVGVFLGSFEVSKSNGREGSAGLVSVGAKGTEHDVLVELDGELLGFFDGFALGGFVVVAVVVVVADPVEAGSSDLVDDEAGGVAVDSGDRLFDRVDAAFGGFLFGHGVLSNESWAFGSSAVSFILTSILSGKVSRKTHGY